VSKVFLILGLFVSLQARATSLVLGLGPDFQVSENYLSPQGGYDDPNDEGRIGGAAFAHIDIPFSEHFGMVTGAEVVQRFMKQDYVGWWIFGSTSGTTHYDIITAEIPLYFEVYLAGGRHDIYAGPRIAATLYQHCSQKIDDPTGAFPCQDKAVEKVFVPFQVGYIFKFTDWFGLNAFVEQTIGHVINKGNLHADAFRTGVTAQFFF